MEAAGACHAWMSLLHCWPHITDWVSKVTSSQWAGKLQLCEHLLTGRCSHCDGHQTQSIDERDATRAHMCWCRQDKGQTEELGMDSPGCMGCRRVEHSPGT